MLRGDENWGGGIQDCILSRCETFEDCIIWARKKFEIYFSYMMKQLIHSFPENYINDKGKRFWAPPKRFPTRKLFIYLFIYVFIYFSK